MDSSTEAYIFNLGIFWLQFLSCLLFKEIENDLCWCCMLIVIQLDWVTIIRIRIGWLLFWNPPFPVSRLVRWICDVFMGNGHASERNHRRTLKSALSSFKLLNSDFWGFHLWSIRYIYIKPNGAFRESRTACRETMQTCCGGSLRQLTCST